MKIYHNTEGDNYEHFFMWSAGILTATPRKHFNTTIITNFNRVRNVVNIIGKGFNASHGWSNSGNINSPIYSTIAAPTPNATVPSEATKALKCALNGAIVHSPSLTKYINENVVFIFYMTDDGSIGSQAQQTAIATAIKNLLAGLYS